MRHTRITQQHLRVQLTNQQLRSLVASGAELDALLCHNPQPIGVPITLFSHAKAYCRGGGWLDIMGYAYDGSDVEHVITRLTSTL